MRLILTGAMLAVLSAIPVRAHDAPTGWSYAPFCCNGDSHNGDCQMISAKTVAITPEGYRVTLVPGDHRLVTRRHVFLLPIGRALPSGDGDYHLCLYPDENTPRCFYAPEMNY